MKSTIILGGGGLIGGHLAKSLKETGNHVRIVDIKNHEYWNHEEICHEFIKCDLTDPKSVELVISSNCDEVYQLAADMDGAGCYPLRILIELFNDDFEIEHSKLNFNDMFDVDISGYATSYNKQKKVFSHIKFRFENYYQNNIEIYGTNGFIKKIEYSQLIQSLRLKLHCQLKIKMSKENIGRDDHFTNMLNN